jgi:hypothetical protein
MQITIVKEYPMTPAEETLLEGSLRPLCKDATLTVIFSYHGPGRNQRTAGTFRLRMEYKRIGRNPNPKVVVYNHPDRTTLLANAAQHLTLRIGETSPAPGYAGESPRYRRARPAHCAAMRA